jgi:hypothetical protein
VTAASTAVWLSAPDMRTAHLPRHPGSDRPLTVCGRVMPPSYRPAAEGMPHCRYCTPRAYTSRPLFRPRTRRVPVERIPLKVGDRIKFRGERQRYTVRAVSVDGRWVICTKPLNIRKTVLYTVIDFDSNVRGPDNYGGLGYETGGQIAAALARFEDDDAEVSYRYDVELDIETLEGQP